MTNMIGILFLLSLSVVAAKASIIEKVARNSDGTLMLVENQQQAIQYCQGLGMHLPSVRELANLAEQNGAAGISETPQDYEKGYRSVFSSSIAGQGYDPELFYYSSIGYKNILPDALEWVMFISSSKQYPLSYPFVLMENHHSPARLGEIETGRIFAEYPWRNYAVICLSAN